MKKTIRKRQMFIPMSAAMVALVLVCFFSSDRWVLRGGEKLADAASLQRQDFYSLKEGDYCGEGGCTEGHGTGYLYYLNDIRDAESMQRAGFSPTEECIEWGGITWRVYNNGFESAVIVRAGDYKGGRLLMYEIIGAA